MWEGPQRTRPTPRVWVGPHSAIETFAQAQVVLQEMVHL